MDWSAIAYILLIAVLGYFLFRYIRANPESISRENLSKSFWVMGMLALILIVFIGGLVLLLRG